MGNGASHWEATDQRRLVRSWEGVTGDVGQCPSAASLETQGLIFWRDRGIEARLGLLPDQFLPTTTWVRYRRLTN